MWLHGKAALTRQAYEREARSLLASVSKPVRAITLQDLQAYQRTFDRLKPSSRATKTGIVKSLLTFAAKVGAISVNVGVMLDAPRVNSRLADRIVEEDDMLRMIQMETDPRNNLLLHLLYLSGCRVSEVAAIRIRDLRQRGREGQVTVIGKGDKERTVLLASPVWKKVLPLLNQPEDAWLFPSRKGGGLKRCQIAKLVKKAAIRAGLPATFSPHYCRHANASHSLDNGAPLSVVQSTLGHASVATTSRYLHSRPNDGTSRYLKG
jgi:integrase/recombinase XerD